jgi:hypothetical protein
VKDGIVLESSDKKRLSFPCSSWAPMVISWARPQGVRWNACEGKVLSWFRLWLLAPVWASAVTVFPNLIPRVNSSTIAMDCHCDIYVSNFNCHCCPVLSCMCALFWRLLRGSQNRDYIKKEKSICFLVNRETYVPINEARVVGQYIPQLRVTEEYIALYSSVTRNQGI